MNTYMYKPENYWNEVAERISVRKDIRIIAGDDEPYYRYKRKKFLQLLNKIDFRNKTVLEIGSGPGGNLTEVLKNNPKELYGVDVSGEMVLLSKQLLKDTGTIITKIDGEHIPFSNSYFDVTFTSTVLQHNTDEKMLRAIIGEICRVTKKDIYIFERIEKTIKGSELCLGRPVKYYQDLFGQQNFSLQSKRFLNVSISYFVSGAIRKLLNQKNRREGEPISGISRLAQKITLPVTSLLDVVFKSRRDVAMLHFKRIS